VSPVTAQNSRYDQFPLVENSWGIIHLVPDMPPPLPVEEEGPPTLKELNPGVIHTTVGASLCDEVASVR
jgi:hypothetical protein